jgi:hypothetical protein
MRDVQRLSLFISVLRLLCSRRELLKRLALHCTKLVNIFLNSCMLAICRLVCMPWKHGTLFS